MRVYLQITLKASVAHAFEITDDLFVNRRVGLAGGEKPWFLIMLSAISLATTLAMGVILGYHARQIFAARTAAARQQQQQQQQQELVDDKQVP